MKLRNRAAWLAAALCLLAAPASADIHRCAGPDGKMFFADVCPMAPNTKHQQAPELNRPSASAAAAPPMAEPPLPDNLPPQPAILPPAAPQPSLASSLPSLPPSAAQTLHRTGMHLGVFFLGLLVFAASGIWFLVVAFSESIVWGLLVLFIPVVWLVFLIMHWSKAWRPFLLNLLGAVVMATGIGRAGPVAQAVQSAMVPCTTEGEPIGPPAASFSNNDFVCLRTDLAWGGKLKEPQLVTWKWYKGGAPTPTDVTPRSIAFTASPMTVSGMEPAFGLGPGTHKVELYLNGILVDTQAFEVR